MKQPQFCTIAPTAYLPQYARFTGSPYHLILAHLLDPASKFYDAGYTEFYQSTKLPGETYIMDNGCFEMLTPYSPDRLVEVGRSVNADILVLPDYPWKPWQQTRDAAIELIPQFQEAGFRSFYVPQSETGDWNGWMESFEWALFNPDIDVIGMSILAHPIALPHIPKGYVRVVAADRVRTWLNADPTRAAAFAEKHIHWLGMLSPGLELPPLLAMEMVDTLDSSNPVWFGHCGLPYDMFTESWIPVSKQYVPEVDFGVHENKRARDVIAHNLAMIGETFRNAQLEKHNAG